jgi:hypothetical protein
LSEHQRHVRIGPLDTVGGVVTEMGKVYRQARRGELDSTLAGRLVYMLTQMRGALEAGVLEERLRKLEKDNGA